MLLLFLFKAYVDVNRWALKNRNDLSFQPNHFGFFAKKVVSQLFNASLDDP